MAAYAALLSLKRTIKRHLNQHPGHLGIPISPELDIMNEARNMIRNTLLALQILESDTHQSREMRLRSWESVESKLLKQFPCEYGVVQFVAKDAKPLIDFIRYTKVDAKDIERIRDESVCRLENVLESLVSALLLDQFRLPDELDRAKHQIDSFIQTVKKIKDGTDRKSKNMVRLSDEFPKITTDLLPEIKKQGKKMLTDLEVTVQSLDMRRSNSSKERMNALEAQIIEAVSEMEDLLETHLTDQFPVPFPLDLHQVRKHIPPFTQLLRKLKQEYMNELIDPLPEEGGDNGDIVSLRNSYGKNKSRLVGLYDEVDKIKRRLFPFPIYLQIIAVFGMGGIGKTTVAEQVFDDPSVSTSFELRAWVEVGRVYQLKSIKQSILDQVVSVDEMLTERRDEQLDEYLHESLEGKRYFIVLDDVWDDNFWDHTINNLFPDNQDGSRVLLTTRRRTSTFDRHQMRFLSKEESWQLLCEKVFGEVSSCPYLLKNAGKTIAESCDGLPLTVVAVGELLSKVEKTPEKWNELAKNPNSLIEKVNNRTSNILLPSYTYLPQCLKACFLYMVVFPLNYEISLSELFKLWIAEKFPKSNVSRYGVESIIKELYQNSLLMEPKMSSSLGIKTWSLHSSFWHLCKREALKNKFSYAMECRGDSFSEGIKNQRRLCIHKNILFGIKDVRGSIASISTARSLLCTGPLHPYPVPICFDLKLLRILSVRTIRLYEFPMDVLKLFQLKYLALTCYENLPSSISKLWSLEILIFCRRHLSISSSRASTFLPIEIWDMKELKHLQIMGSDLLDPCEDGTMLPNLETLLDVSPHSCKKDVFQATPNLKKLSIRIELMPDDGHVTETLRCFDHIYRLEKLLSLKCVVVNPTFGPDITPPPLAIFPSSLEKLSLSGFGYPWEDMSLIARLPNLKTLKLRCFAFRGPELEIKGVEFPKLRFLLIEDTDLVNWTIEFRSLRNLGSIFIKSCYKLENIRWDKYGVMTTELVNCYKLRNVPNSWCGTTNKFVWEGL
ncbi:hypothetical protein CASFOL_002586 [Castilleja foliolosa]|uniref:NB-ARC domain-containing protein n=1 Tax=Castilleja foliolosa TaxID=1961234 RepID=A0ABD3EEQ2_9LAMI